MRQLASSWYPWASSFAASPGEKPVFLCYVPGSRNLFLGSATEKKHLICTTLLSTDMRDRHLGREFSYALFGVLERLRGPQDKALQCASRDYGSWPWCCHCCSVLLCNAVLCLQAFVSPALSILCASCSGQRLLCITLCAGIRSLRNAEELILYYYW